jgi:hypothetical protein
MRELAELRSNRFVFDHFPSGSDFEVQPRVEQPKYAFRKHGAAKWDEPVIHGDYGI